MRAQCQESYRESDSWLNGGEFGDGGGARGLLHEIGPFDSELPMDAIVAFNAIDASLLSLETSRSSVSDIRCSRGRGGVWSSTEVYEEPFPICVRLFRPLMMIHDWL